MSPSAGLPTIISRTVDRDNETESEYRLSIDRLVKYLKIAPGTFESDDLFFPLAPLPPLDFRDSSWTVAHVSRRPNSDKLDISLSTQNLAAVQNVWHDVRVHVLDLAKPSSLTARAFEAEVDTSMTTLNTSSLSPSLLPKTTVIAKIARFEWEIPAVEQETRAYQLLQQEHGSSRFDLAPRFLGHLHENGRVMGFMLEKLINKTPASLSNLEECKMALARFQGFGLLHGDVNRNNFLVGQDGNVKLIDFEQMQEHAAEFQRTKEMQSLGAELVDQSGRGGGFIFSGDDEE